MNDTQTNRSALEVAILDEREEFTKQAPSLERTENIAACDRLLARMARNATKSPRPLNEKERLVCDMIVDMLDRLPTAEARS